MVICLSGPNGVIGNPPRHVSNCFPGSSALFTSSPEEKSQDFVIWIDDEQRYISRFVSLLFVMRKEIKSPGRKPSQAQLHLCRWDSFAGDLNQDLRSTTAAAGHSTRSHRHRCGHDRFASGYPPVVTKNSSSRRVGERRRFQRLDKLKPRFHRTDQPMGIAVDQSKARHHSSADTATFPMASFKGSILFADRCQHAVANGIVNRNYLGNGGVWQIDQFWLILVVTRDDSRVERAFASADVPQSCKGGSLPGSEDLTKCAV